MRCEWTHRSPGRTRPDHFRLVACSIVIRCNLDTAPRTNLRVAYRILVRFRPCLSDCTYLYSHFYPAHFTSSNHTSEPVQTCVSGRPSQWHRRRPTNRARLLSSRRLRWLLLFFLVPSFISSLKSVLRTPPPSCTSSRCPSGRRRPLRRTPRENGLTLYFAVRQWGPVAYRAQVGCQDFASNTRTTKSLSNHPSCSTVPVSSIRE